MEAQLHHTHGRHYDDPHRTVNDSPAVRSGLVEPTDMGTPVLVEDLYATHSDIVDPPVRAFAQWEEEERQGAPPPQSSGIYGTDLAEFGRHGFGEDVKREKSKGDIGKSSGVGEVPSAPKPAKAFSPVTHQAKVTDRTDTGSKEVGITDVLHSFDKMRVYDEPYSKSPKSDQKEPKGDTGSHDQFGTEPVENPPLNTIANPSSESSSVTGKKTSATSASADKAAAAKDKSERSSGSQKSNTKSSFPGDYVHKVADTLSPVYVKMVGAGSSVMSKIQGSGDDEIKRVGVKEYLVERFRPGDDDKVVSEVITHALQRGKGNAPQHTTARDEEGERRLQESAK